MQFFTAHIKKVSRYLSYLFIVLIFFSGCDLYGYINSFTTVRFDSNGGTEVPSQTVLIGDYLEAPSIPTNRYYRFNGWYLGNKKWNFEEDIVEKKGMTLVAKWTPDNPANYDSNAASQLLRGTWTNGIYTITFKGYTFYGGVTSFDWTGYGSSGTSVFWCVAYDSHRNVMYLGYDFMPVDIIFNIDGTTMEVIDRVGTPTCLPPGTWTKVD